MSNKEMSCQIAVVGTGPGGAVASYELKKAGFDVLSIEEGGEGPFHKVAPFSIEELLEFYRYNGLSVALGSPNIPYVEGRGVGGGSLINCGIITPPSTDVLDSWGKDFLLKKSSWEELYPFFLDLISDLDIFSKSNIEDKTNNLLDGAIKFGVYKEHTLSTFREERLGSLRLNYLKWFELLGGKVLKNNKIIKIKKTGTKWVLTGKQRPAGIDIKINADFVFLAGGAIQTPMLLQRSGFRRNVGSSFQLQPVLKSVALYDDDVNSGKANVSPVRLASFENFKIESSVSHLNHLSLSLLNYKYADHELIKNFKKFAHFSITFKTSAIGSVKKIPFLNEPFVYYKVSEDDLLLFSTGLKTLSKILLEGGARKIYPALKGHSPIACLKDIDNIPLALNRNQLNLSAVHLFGTCPMGENLNKCVTNSFGKVHEAEELYIIDGSLLCGSIGDNPQGTIMTFAKRNIKDFILKNKDAL